MAVSSSFRSILHSIVQSTVQSRVQLLMRCSVKWDKEVFNCQVGNKAGDLCPCGLPEVLQIRTAVVI